MKKTLAVLLATVAPLVIFGSAHAAWVSFDESQEARLPEIRVLSSNGSQTTIEVRTYGMDVLEVSVEGEAFQQLSLLQGGTTQEIGKPELPRLAASIGIPEEAVASVKVIKSYHRTLSGYKVYPFQEPEVDFHSQPFSIDRGFYSRNIVYPEARAVVSEPAIWRDLTLLNLGVYPLQYNPAKGELTVTTKIVVRVDHPGGKMGIRTVEPEYGRLYETTILNYGYLNLGHAPSVAPGVRYLVITHPSLDDDSNPLVAWHHRRGIETRVISRAGWTAQAVKDSILAEYNRHAPAVLRWVLLIGDVGYVPTYGGYGFPSDSWYSLLVGGDYYAEVGIGRLSVNDKTELDRQISKIVRYEKDPLLGSWLDRSVLVAHKEDYPDKYSRCKREIYNYSYSFFDPVLDTIFGGAGGTNAMVSAAINNGRNVVNYRGHGDLQEWWHWASDSSSWTNANVSALANGDQTPIVLNIACHCHNITVAGDCLGERWLRKFPGGAAASLGASDPSYTVVNHDYDKALYWAYCGDGSVPLVWDVGWMSNAASAYILPIWGGMAEENVKMYLWLGDPACEIWRGIPKEMVVLHPETARVGPSKFKVKVSYAGSPIEGALVCLEKGDEVYEYGYTNASGRVFFTISPATAGTMYVTVTAHNYLPYQGQAEIIPGLDIVQDWLSGGFVPPNPWDQPGLVELDFKVTALGGDLTHIRFFSDPLEHGHLPKKIPDHLVEFIPEEIGFLGPCDTASVAVKVEVPIGQHWGSYRGWFRTVACNGASDSVFVTIHVDSLPDLDIDDDHGNLVANTMELEGVAGSVVSGVYIMVNPNMWESNVDLFDGPGNIDLDRLTYLCTDLISYGGTDTIPASNVNPNVRGIYSLPHSDAAENLVEVTIPPDKQISTTYAGTVTVTAQPGGVSDYFTLKVTVVPTAPAAPVVVEGDTLPRVYFTPTDPWVQEGLLELTFHVTSEGDLIHVSLSSDDLLHETLDKKIAGTSVNFVPQEIGHLGPDDTVAVTAYVQIPIGQHVGQYEGYFRVVACNGTSDAVLVRVRVNPLADLDIQDYAGDLSANRMRLVGPSGSIVAGTFNEVNPNMWDNNYDPFDGPGNVDLYDIDYLATDLVCTQGHTIPSGQVTVPGPCALASGEAHQHIVAVDLTDIHPNEKDYSGYVFARVAGDSEDVFTLVVNVDASGQLCGNGFRGEAGEEGNLLEWRFAFNQQGFNLYRSEPGGASFVRLNSSLMDRTSYMDRDVLAGLCYEYKIGLVFGDGEEVLLGPLSVTALRGPCYALFQSYPNPFVSSTLIRYALPPGGGDTETRRGGDLSTHQLIKLSVYDVSGRLVRTLVNEEQEPGTYSTSWDGKAENGVDVAGGVYFCRLAAGGAFTAIRKLVVLR